MKIEFADEFFDSLEELEMTPEEQQEFIDDLTKKAEDGSLFDDSEPVSDEEAEEMGLGDFTVNRTIN